MFNVLKRVIAKITICSLLAVVFVSQTTIFESKAMVEIPASGRVYKIVSKQSGKVLDVYGAINSDGTQVQQYGSNDTLAQRWVVVSAGNGYYKIRPYCVSKGRRVLDLSGGYTYNGNKIQIWSDNGSNAYLYIASNVCAVSP